MAHKGNGEADTKPWPLSYRSMLNPSFATNHSNLNKPEILQLEIGAGGGIANAGGSFVLRILAVFIIVALQNCRIQPAIQRLFYFDKIVSLWFME